MITRALPCTEYGLLAEQQAVQNALLRAGEQPRF